MKDWIFNEAVNLLHEGEKAKAAQIIAKYIKRYPHDVQAWLLLSDALEDQKKIEFAINKALEIDPTNKIALEKFKQIKEHQKETTNFFDSPFIDLDSSVEEGQSESFVYTPEYDQPKSEEKPFAETTNAKQATKQGSSKKETHKSDKEENDEKSHKIIGTFFLLILIVGLFTAIYITKSIWVPKLIPLFDRPIQIYMETFEENKRIVQLGQDFKQASTEVANYLNPSPTPILTPTPMPTLTNNEVIANQIKSEVEQIKLLSESNAPKLSQVEPTQLQEIASKTYTEDEIQKLKTVWVALGWIEPTFDLKTYLENDQYQMNAYFDSDQNLILIDDPNFSSQTQSDYAYAYIKYLQTYGVMKEQTTTEMTLDHKLTNSAFYDGDARYTQLLVEQLLSDTSQFRTDDFTYTNWAIPPALFAQKNFAYQYGLSFIESIFQNGQMIGIQSAYSNPPQTTEQILHIDKFYAKEVGITIPVMDLTSLFGSNWTQVASDSLGEWGTYQILFNNSKSYARVEEALAQSAAAGWGGDRYQVYQNTETQETILIIQWIMDSDIDANELVTALNQSNIGRFSYNKPIINETICHSQTPYTSCVFSNDRNVLWIVSPDEALIPTIIDRYPAVQ